MAITFRNIKASIDDDIFVGIDQSMTHTGITIIHRSGEILYSGGFSTSTDMLAEERFNSIRNFVFSKLDKCDISITSVGIEGLAFNRSGTNNGALLFGLFAILITELHSRGFKYSVIPPTSLKKFSTGNGRAEKEDMLESIDKNDLFILREISKVKNKKKFEDIVDSYWLAKRKLEESKEIDSSK